MTSAAYELAQVNIGRLKAPLDSPQLKDFVDALDPVNAVADTSAGFVCGIITRGDLERAGAIDPSLRPACVGCGGHHHVNGDRGVPFCPCCLERGHPIDELDPYEEVGIGD